MTSQGPPRVFSSRHSRVGVVFATLFFAFSLFPSLLPRTALFQGVVSGVTVAVGYGFGAMVEGLWRYLGIPSVRGRARTVLVWISLALVGFAVASAIWQYIGWQNDVRDLMGMESIDPLRWPVIAIVAALVAAVLIILARSIRRLFILLRDWLDRILPRRVAVVLGIGVLVLAGWFLYSGVLVNGFFAGANALFSTRDTATNEGVTQPQTPGKSGSPESLVSWESLGRQGRNFVATGPTVDELNAYHGGGAIEPIRVYAGLKSADTLEARAQLVLDELIRTEAFDREILVVATTTGTGFLDEDAVDPLEYIYNGDSAIAGVQYSYLPSWISLLADQQAVRETSQEVFETVHAYWTQLPEDERPELYLYGLSLGSFGVESVLTSINIVNEPIDGALLTGPPFVNPLHDDLVDDRVPGSAPWRPIYQDGSTVRFTAQEYGLDIPDGPWGPTRIAYLQHGSDPVVFFSTDLALGPPDWLLDDDQRSPDVSDEMVWVPVVTMWQVLADLPAAGSVPEGFGHLYPMVENAQSWIAVTRPDGWTGDDTAELLVFLDEWQAAKAAEKG